MINTRDFHNATSVSIEADKLKQMKSKDDRIKSQLNLIMEYFKKNPNRDIEHPEVVDWVVAEYKRRTGKVFRDPDRGIRSLSQKGALVKVGKGVYRYEPSLIIKRDLEDFTPAQREAIMKRDNYRCVVCG